MIQLEKKFASFAIAIAMTFLVTVTSASAMTPRVSVPEVTVELVEAANLPRSLNIDQAKFLVHSGFYIEPTQTILDKAKIKQDDLIDLYELLRTEYPKTARFITADLAFHAFNLYSNRALQKLENRVLIQRTADLLAAIRDAISRMALRPDNLGLERDLARAALTRAHNFISLGLYLVSGGTELLPIQSDIREFAGNILAGSGTGKNPFTGATQNFSDFRPTGHYTRNEATQAHYRTLKLLATDWPVTSATSSATDEDSIITSAAALVLQKILEDQRVNARWHALCDPLQAITGSSASSTARTGARKPTTFAVLPRERMIFDELVYQSLTAPNVPDRTLPDVLDVLAAFGSAGAKLEVEDIGRDYSTALSDVTSRWRSFDNANASVYGDVLRALRAYMNTNGPKAKNGSKQYFATLGAWEYKKMATGAAVLAELRQDTAPIFARDFAPLVTATGTKTAASGSGEPFGYVEPVPEVYTLLASAARRLAGVLEPLLTDNKSTPEYWFGQLDAFAQQMEKLAEIATREKSDTVTQSDFEYIKNFSLPRVLSEGFGTPLNDSARDSLRTARTGQVRGVTLATGAPLRMIVWVNDKSGGFRVAEGYVLSFFSFPGNVPNNTATNNNDANWRSLVYAPWVINSEERGPLPPELERGRPSWFKKIYF